MNNCFNQQTLNDRVLPNDMHKSVTGYQGKEEDQNNISLGNWATRASEQNMNRSAIVQKKSSGFAISDKLIKMREKIKRERSANAEQKQSDFRESSLYGRKKIGQIEDETQKLRESYSQHRTVGGRTPTKSVASIYLQKQNFKEDPFDRDEDTYMQRARGSASFDRNMRGSVRQSDKENAQGQANELSQTRDNSHNRSTNLYKRSQQKSNQTLATYQQKYERLEKNFQKFSNNIKHSNQTEEMILQLKQKTAFSIIDAFSKKVSFQDTKAAFKLWRLNSGVAYRQEENEKKVLVLAKYCQKYYQRSLNYVKIQCYQKWKHQTFTTADATSSTREHATAIMSEMMTDSQDFNRCIENDLHLSKTLNLKLTKIMNTIVSSDIFLYTNEDQEGDNETLFKAYNDSTGDQYMFTWSQIMSQSCILGSVLHKGDMSQDLSEKSQASVHLFERIASNPHYNQEIDSPINEESISDMNDKETNQFNRVRGLSMALINVEQPRIGVIRLYFNAGTVSSLPRQPQKQISAYQMKQINQIANVVPLFIQRIFDVRAQINSLAFSNMDHAQQIRDLEFYNTINTTLKDYQTKINQDETILSTLESTMEFTRLEIESFMKNYFDIENIQLKQIVYKNKSDPSAPQDGELLLQKDVQVNKGDLVRFNDHTTEDKEVIEDFLDHKKEYFIHQISICPKSEEQVDTGLGTLYNKTTFSDYTFILHEFISYNRDQNTSQVLNASTSAHSVSMFSQRHPSKDRRLLEADLKGKLLYYFKQMIPIIKSSQSVAGGYQPKITQLTKRLRDESIRYDVSQFLHNFVSEHGLIQDINYQSFYTKLSQALFLAMKQFDVFSSNSDELENQDDLSQSYFCILNRQAFHRKQLSMTSEYFRQFQFQAFLSDTQMQELDKHIIQKFTNNLDNSVRSGIKNFDVYGTQDEAIKEIGLSQDILPFDQQTSREGRRMKVVLPIINKVQFQTLTVLVFDIDERNLPMVSYINNELSTFLQNFMEKRQTYQALQDKHDKLLESLDGEKMSQETKDVIDQYLVLPYLKKQSLKSLGEGIDYLCDTFVINSGEQMDQPGQEISQIAYIGPKAYIEDVRLLKSYNQNKQEDDASQYPDQMMLQSYNQKQQIVYEDEIMGKVVILYPIINTLTNLQQNSYGNYSQTSVQNTSAIILRFVIDNDNLIQQKLQNIHMQLIKPIQPTIIAILSGGGVLLRPQLGLQKLSNVVNKYKHIQYREMIYFMRDLKANNVYNFSRSRLYDQIAKSRKFIEIYNAAGVNEKNESKFFDVDKKNMDKHQIIQNMIGQAVVVMNRQAWKFKQMQFKKFMIGTRKPIYANMSKRKKKGIVAIIQHKNVATLREVFSKFAINTKMFKNLRHPKTKYLASINCLFRNYRICSERLAFLKMKKNLNLKLRQAMNSYFESDKDLFIQLNQILVSSYSQQGGLEGGFMYALNEIFQYLKNLKNMDHYYHDYGNLANENFVGHIDEAILTLKSCAYTSHGGSLTSQSSGSSSQKIRIFVSQLSDQPLKPNHNTDKHQAIRFSYDSNLPVSQQDQLLNQINISNIDNDFTNQQQLDASDFESQFAQPFQKHQISLKRDLIHQMLLKSNGIIFNFQNIQHSLSDVFLGQQSNQKDHNIGNRFATVRRSKSSLIIPLFDVGQQGIVGSLELYRHHQQAFTEEIEARFDFFSKRIADFFMLYGQLKAQNHQIQQLKLQMQKTVAPMRSLSQLLKNVYVNAPGNHFQGACHVLPIIILNQTVRKQVPCDFNDALMSQQNTFINGMQSDTQFYEPSSSYFFEGVIQNRLAFFFNFKDNMIYNFEYEGTFIEELMQNGCILEMCQKNSMAADENQNPDTQQNTQREFELGSISQSSYRSSRFGHSHKRHKTIESSEEKVKSVTNQLFKHIIYYPVFDVDDEQKIIAIIEVAYKKKRNNVSEQIMNEEVQQYLDQFRSHLSQFKVRLSNFAKGIENVYSKKFEKRKATMFHRWKENVLTAQFNEQAVMSQNQQLQNQEMCYSDYMNNLQQANNQLREVQTAKHDLTNQIQVFNTEKKAKLKFLATSLVSSNNLFRKLQLNRLKQAFLKWQFNASIRKIAETAFNRVLELNHRHSKARLRTGVFLLKSVLDNYTIQGAFNCIVDAAHMKKARNYRNRQQQQSAERQGSRSRSQNRNVMDGSLFMDNITSILSPHNLKKIERKNLYEKQINSFYTPIGVTRKEGTNTSAIINPINLAQTENYASDGGSLPFIQLKPHEIIKNQQSRTSMNSFRGDEGTRATTQNLLFKTGKQLQSNASRYSNNLTTFTHANLNMTRQSHMSKRNPYSDLNASQIEYTANKRDYSPIITTSKYDLRKIYDPYNKSAMDVKYENTSLNDIKLGNQNQVSGQIQLKGFSTSMTNKKSRSVDNFKAHKRKTSALAMIQNQTKAQLQKELLVKQYQLDKMKKMLKNSVKGMNKGRSKSRQRPVRQSFNSNRSLSQNSFKTQEIHMNKDISCNSITQQKTFASQLENKAPKPVKLKKLTNNSRGREKSTTSNSVSIQLRKASTDNRNNSRKDNSMMNGATGEILGQTSIESISQDRNTTYDNQKDIAAMSTPLHLLVDRQMAGTLGTKDLAPEFQNHHQSARPTNININEGNFSPPIPRDYSPPVRQSRADSGRGRYPASTSNHISEQHALMQQQKEQEQKERQNAKKNVLQALHQRYQDLRDEDEEEE